MRPIRTASEHVIEVPRSARYYVIGERSSPGKELWIVLHGFGQLACDFVEYFATLNDGDHVVVAPEALNRYYTQPVSVPSADRKVGATWMTKEFRDAEIADYVRYLDLLHEDLVSRLRPARTVVVGFSQGGATAMRWMMQGKTTASHVVLWGATLPPDVDLSLVNDRLRGAALHLVIGRTDQYISANDLAKERARLDGAAVRHDVLEYDAGHAIKRTVLAELMNRFRG
jgi:predicted esterase